MTPFQMKLLQTLIEKYLPLPDINKGKDSKKEEKF